MRSPLNFQPKLWSALQGYNRQRFGQDVGAGITVGVVALPLAIAFAIASGVAPLAGLTTAIIAGFLISALGGSRVQIGGPAGAFIVIIYGIVAQYGLANLLIATMLAGVLLFIMGLLRIGNLVRFIPVAVITGFTNGIAVLIALSQIRDFFGLTITKMPADFFSSMHTLYTHAHTANLPSIVVASLALLLIIFWPKTYAPQQPGWRYWASRIPATIVALGVTTVLVFFTELPVATIGSRFGELPNTLPTFALPEFSWHTAKQLIAPTMTIALLGAIESLLCARVADNLRTEMDSRCVDRHDPNQELMAQGIANFVVPFFGGIPATGTIARTVTNIRSGANSPIAGIVHALTLLLVLLVAAPVATHIPLPALAAILIFVAYNMGEWRAFPKLRQFSLPYRIILISTFLLTVIFDLTVAVEVGLVLASLFFIYRIADLTRLDEIELPANTPTGIKAYRLYGSLFFGAIHKLEVLLEATPIAPRVIILDLHQLISLDTSGVESLQVLHKTLAAQKVQLVLCQANKQPYSLMRRSGLLDEIGHHHYCSSFDTGLQQALQLAQQN